MLLEQFIGTWELVSMVEMAGEKIIGKPYGESPLGYITYTDTGFMHAILMKRDRSLVGVSIEDLGSVKKKWAVFAIFRYFKALMNYFKASASFSAYSGIYEIKNDKICHHVKSSFFPDWINNDLIRDFEFFNDKLKLTAHNNDSTRIELVWQKKD